jgi:hypothetical protein
MDAIASGTEGSTGIMGQSKSQAIVDEINRQRRDEQKRLAWEIVRLSFRPGNDVKIKYLQNECRVLERADMDLSAIIREISHER